MLKYEDVLNDKEVISLIDSINSDEYKLNHSKRHIFKVVEYAEDIAKQLNCDDKFINNVKIAALLHDVGMTVQRKNHAEYSYEISKKYIDKKDIDEEEKEEILNAIRKHSNAKDSNDLMQYIIVASDKIDIDKSRMMPKAYLSDINKNLVYINDVKLEITDNDVNFLFDVEDGHFKDICIFLEDWPKPVTEIKRFAKFLNKTPHFLFNDKEEVFDKEIFKI